ncbi:rod shape-determining protein [Candidatus Kaiserbacteria bacterium]|nr:rod shape-determining protein [Candidatus Kaiserbacteria bacterium]
MKTLSKYIEKFFASVSTDIGIDLGTANTLVYVKGRGIVLNEPTIVAVNTKTGQLVAVGAEAKTMLGRTPNHVEVVRPLVDGVISDFEVTEEMLSYLIGKVCSGSRSLIAPRVLVGVPSGITNVEMRAARDAARNAGARDVLLVEEPIAAAVGAKLPVHKAQGSMIIDIGGGTTDIAVLSLNGIVTSKNLRIAGDRLNRDIISYIRDQFKVLVGEKTAEETKVSLASVNFMADSKEVVVRGRDVVTGLPREVVITDTDIREAIGPSINAIVEAVRDVIEATPPEVLADVMQRGMYISGGGALIPGVSELLEEVLKLPVVVVPDPLRAVVRGTGIILENLEQYEELLIENEGELSPQL